MPFAAEIGIERTAIVIEQPSLGQKFTRATARSALRLSKLQILEPEHAGPPAASAWRTAPSAQSRSRDACETASSVANRSSRTSRAAKPIGAKFARAGSARAGVRTRRRASRGNSACSMRRPEHRASDCARSPIVWARDPTKMVNGDHADLYRAELRALFADVDRGVMRPVAVARCVERLTKIGASDERPAERVERENAWALREMDKRGNSREFCVESSRSSYEGPSRSVDVYAAISPLPPTPPPPPRKKNEHCSFEKIPSC